MIIVPVKSPVLLLVVTLGALIVRTAITTLVAVIILKHTGVLP